MNDVKSSVYAQKVELLLRLIPIVMDEGVFAIHGGTAINLKKLAKQNPQKLQEEVEKLKRILNFSHNN